VLAVSEIKKMSHLLIALMMEAARTSEMSVNYYQTTQFNIPEDSNLNTRRRENLNYHLRLPCSEIFLTCLF
jgi:hypothetical protein